MDGVLRGVCQRQDVPRIFIASPYTDSETFRLPVRDQLAIIERSLNAGRNASMFPLRIEDIFTHVLLPRVPLELERDRLPAANDAAARPGHDGCYASGKGGAKHGMFEIDVIDRLPFRRNRSGRAG